MNVQKKIDRDGYDAIVRSEVANELLNEAKGRLIERLYAIEGSNPQLEADLQARMAHIHSIQQALDCNDVAATESVIAEWKGRLSNGDALFLDQLVAA